MTPKTLIPVLCASALAAGGAWWARGEVAMNACLDAGGCWRSGDVYCDTAINPLAIAEGHARTLLPPESTPTGLERIWIVEDHGDIWTVELTGQGSVGGGTRIGIRKGDGAILGS